MSAAQKSAAFLRESASRGPPHGSRIYAYNHIITNQVVYSLTRTLNNTSALKQLTFAGKKSVPRALRKDHWKPLFTVKFGLPDQGLKAFRKLREWRKLHEYSWNPSDVKELTYTQEVRDKREENKERTDFQINMLGVLPREHWIRKDSDWRRRVRHTIMDQKANSVADLAAVLLEQEKAEIIFNKDNEAWVERQWKWLSEVLKGSDTVLQRKLDQISKQLEAERTALARLEAERTALAPLEAKRGTRRYVQLENSIASCRTQIKTRRVQHFHLFGLKTKLRKIEQEENEQLKKEEQNAFKRIVETALVEEGHTPVVAKKLINAWNAKQQIATNRVVEREESATPYASLAVEERTEARVAAADGPKLLSERVQGLLFKYRRVRKKAIERYSARLSRLKQSEQAGATDEIKAEVERPEDVKLSTDETMKKVAGPEDMELTARVPGYGVITIKRWWRTELANPQSRLRALLAWEGGPRPQNQVRLADVRVEWARLLDAEYSAAWPAQVEHDAMGLVRNTAPKDGERRVLTLENKYGLDKSNALVYLGTGSAQPAQQLP